MAEFIITSEQLEKMLGAFSGYLMVGELMGYEPSQPVNEVVISGDELPVLVHCRDCKQYNEVTEADGWCDLFDYDIDEPDGFCKWGEAR